MREIVTSANILTDAGIDVVDSRPWFSLPKTRAALLLRCRGGQPPNVGGGIRPEALSRVRKNKRPDCEAH